MCPFVVIVFLRGERGWGLALAATDRRLSQVWKFPWDVVVAAKLTIATPIPDNNDLLCYVTNPPTRFPSGSGCTPFGPTPPGLGYRTLDMELTKDFNVRDVSTLSVRVDVLNIFNVKNYNDYILGGNNGTVNATQFLGIGSSQGTRPRRAS